MASKTQIVCLHEGVRGNTDSVFINRLIRSLKPAWLKPFPGNNFVRLVPCGGRNSVIQRMPRELKICLNRGVKTTLMVWADLDHDMKDGNALRNKFWQTAQAEGVTEKEFNTIVFVFAKDRLENWIQYLNEGSTDEAVEGPRQSSNRKVAEAAKKLADRCSKDQSDPPLPCSLEWSCKNWRELRKRMI